MREIGSVETEELARRLVSYLATQSIGSSRNEEDGGWTIWVLNDEDLPRARQILSEFRQSPDAPEYLAAVVQAKELSRAAEQEQRLIRRRKIDVTQRWRGSWWHSHPATQILIGICVAVVLLCTNWHNAAGPRIGLPQTCNNERSELRNALFIQPPRQLRLGDEEFVAFQKASVWSVVRTGQLWRLVTPIFLHFDILHILFNMMWLRQLGTAVEFVRGTKRFLLLILILAVTSNLAQLVWSGPSFGGMSGVVFGLIGYVWMKGRTQPQLGLGLMPDQVVYSFLWLGLCLSGAVGPIANAAHLAGFAGGILVGARQAVIRGIRGSADKRHRHRD